MKIITHSGSFHSDEIFAIALIKLALNELNPEIIRTRDNAILQEGIHNDSTWVIDVGGHFDPQSLNFDHHQNAFKLTWPDTIPKSSIGIVWDYIHANNLMPLEEDIKSAVEFNLIKRIDAHDNGVRPWNMACVFGMYNRTTNNDAQFQLALKTANDFLINSINMAEQKSKDNKILKVSLDSYDNGKVLIINDFLSGIGRKIAMETPAVSYVMPHDKHNTKWVAHSVPDTKISFGSRSLAPKKWRGLSGYELQQISGLSDAIFVHKKGFICVSESKETAIRMAEMMANS